MICPICEKQIEKAKPGGYCPECNGALSKIERTDGNGETFYDYIPRTDKEEYEEPAPTYKIIKEAAGIKVEKHSQKNKWVVWFSGLVINSWIYCPNPKCGKKLTMNHTLRGTQQLKCDRCKAVITYNFNVGMRIPR